jgi:hypothetical protein
MLCDTCETVNDCLKSGCRTTIYVSALEKQVSGAHYKDKAIQPIIYIHANNLGFCEGNVVKYITRWREKNGIADLEKAKHYIELLIEMENAPK